MHPYLAAHMIDRATLAAADMRRATAMAETIVAKLRAEGDAEARVDGIDLARWIGAVATNRAAADTAQAVAEALKAGDEPPRVERHVGWAFVVRGDTHLPMPGAVTGPRSLGIQPSLYAHRPALACGDYLIRAERGGYADALSVSLLRIDPTGTPRPLDTGNRAKAQISDAIKAGICEAHPAIIKGSGQTAAVVRRILAERGGFVQTSQEAELWAREKKEIEQRIEDAARAEKIDDDDADALAALCSVDF